MPKEIEIKLKIRDASALRRALKRLHARPVGSASGCVHEWNVIFDTPQGGLAKHGQLLRIRIETPEGKSKSRNGAKKKRIVLTFKRPVTGEMAGPEVAEDRGRHKIREEIEVEVADAAVLSKVFEGLGMRGWFRYEKYRTTFSLPGTKAWAKGLLIELDETPIGTFVELEGPPAAIDRAAKELGYSKRDYILKNYLVLYVEECRRLRKVPNDLVFAASSSAKEEKKSKK
jgi:adenylate cyclase class 2